MTRLQLLVLFFSIAVSSVARAEQGPSSASASGTVRIVVPAVAGITIPRQVSEAAGPGGGGQSIRFATYSSTREGGIALIRSAARGEIVLASNRREKGAVALQAGWSVNEHRLPPAPVRTSGGAQRVVMEVWQF